MNRSKVANETCTKCGSDLLPAMIRCRECGTAKESFFKPKNTKASPPEPAPSKAHAEPIVQSRPATNLNPSKKLQSIPENKPKVPPTEPAKPKTNRINAHCKKCAELVKAPVSLAGTVVPCPKCGTKVKLPKLASNRKQKSAGTSPESSSDQANLLAAIQDALKNTEQNSVEPQFKESKTLRGRAKKLVGIVEGCCGSLESFETIKSARTALQEISTFESSVAGSMLLDLLPKLPDRIRGDAIRSLGALKVQEALEPLLYTLLSSSSSDVEAAILALGDLGNSAAVKPLLLLPELRPDQRIRASVAISKLGETALPVLLEVLENSNSESVRFSVMEALKSLKSQKSLDSLLSVIQRDRTVLRRMAVEALGEIDHPKRHRVLMKLAQDQDDQVRSIVIESLAKKPHQASIVTFLQALDDRSLNVQKSAIVGIGELGDFAEKGVVSRIIKFLDSDDQDVQFLAAMTISKLGDKRITPQILKLLKSEIDDGTNVINVRDLIRCLQKLKDPRAVLPLCEYLEDGTDSKTARRIIEALGAIGDQAAKSAIEHQLERNGEKEVRAAAAQALGSIGEHSAIPSLTQALHDHQTVRIQALIALGKLKATNVGPLVKEMLSDPSPTVRYQAISIISESNNKELISSLVPLALDSDEMVQRAVFKALKALGDERTEKEVRKEASKSQRGLQARSLQHRLVPSSVVGLFSGVPGGMATGVLAASTLLVVMVSFIFVRSDASASAKAVVVRGYVDGIGVDEKGEILIVSRTRGLTEVWNVKTGQRSWSGENVPTSKHVAYSSNAKTALIAKREVVYLFDVSSVDGALSNPVEKSSHSANITDIASSANRHITATMDAERTVHVWNMKSKQSIGNFTASAGASKLALNSTGEMIAVGGNQGSVQIWTADATEPIYDNTDVMKSLQITGETKAIAFSSDSKYLAHVVSSGVLVIVEFETGKLISKTTLPPGKMEIYFNPADELVILSGKISVLKDLSTGEPQVVGDSIRALTANSFCAQTNNLFMGSDEEKPVVVMSMQSGKTVDLDTE